jgi:hypothetical protein
MDTQNNEGKKPEDTSIGNAGNSSATASDQSAKIAELQARLEKETKEKEIYRSGLMAAKELGRTAKRVTAETLEDPAKLEEAIDAKIQERELERKTETDVEARLAEDKRLREENEELRRSLESAKASGGFGGSASTGSGHNESSESKPQGYFSDAQRGELVAMYRSREMYTPEQITKMVARAEELARSRAGGTARGNDLVKTRSY